MNILFLCVANSARSQMAEGLAKFVFGTKASIFSAGSKPTGYVHKFAIKVMAEQGIDISQNQSKSFEALPSTFFKNLDFVITLCADEVCPVVRTQATKLHWPHPDPASAPENEQIKSFQNVRDQIKLQLEDFYEQIFPKQK